MRTIGRRLDRLESERATGRLIVIHARADSEDADVARQCSALNQETGVPVSDRDLVIVVTRFCRTDGRFKPDASVLPTERIAHLSYDRRLLRCGISIRPMSQMGHNLKGSQRANLVRSTSVTGNGPQSAPLTLCANS